jgi:hypothetical protein
MVGCIRRRDVVRTLVSFVSIVVIQRPYREPNDAITSRRAAPNRAISATVL